MDESDIKEKNKNAETEFLENLKQLEEQSRIEGIKLKIKEEIRILQDRKLCVQNEYSKLSNAAIKEKKEKEAYIAQFDLKINELNKQYRQYDKN